MNKKYLRNASLLVRQEFVLVCTHPARFVPGAAPVKSKGSTGTPFVQFLQYDFIVKNMLYIITR
jgi:hypothetical protein